MYYYDIYFHLLSWTLQYELHVIILGHTSIDNCSVCLEKKSNFVDAGARFFFRKCAHFM